MISHDLSIVVRFNPQNSLLASQFLTRREELLVEEEWHWQEDRGAAYVFQSHALAAAWCAENRYVDSQGETHTAWAVVLSATCEARQRREATAVMRLEASIQGAPRVTPQQCFAANEKRGLA